MQTPVIIHCIDSLAVGGAEILLKNTIRSLPQFRHIVVYLRQPDTLKKEMPEQTEFYCLGFQGWADFFAAVRRLKRIIKDQEPVLIHSHLFYSTLIARVAAGRTTPLVTSLHSMFSLDAFEKNRLSVWAERLTLKKRHGLIAVSRFILNDYLSRVRHTGKSFVLYNFLPESAFRKKSEISNASTLKCLAVGGLKEVKNYPYLLKLFETLKGESIELDIFGEGQLRNQLQQDINARQLKVNLKGQNSQLDAVLADYDLFIQASMHEGFGLSVIEAMARGIPVFVSDIPVFHEVTADKAHFFPLDDWQAATGKLKCLLDNQKLRMKYVDEAFTHAVEEYNQQKYIKNLLTIYSDAGALNLISREAIQSAPGMFVTKS